jgi:arsenate reductase
VLDDPRCVELMQRLQREKPGLWAEDIGEHYRHKVAFVCTANSCRSQMAEGWARALHGDRLDAFSAGVRASTLNPLAVRAMAEAGVDISGHASKTVGDLPTHLGVAITVCSSADQACPAMPGAVRRIHAPFDDPPHLAQGARTDDEAMPHYRRVRDEIRAWVERELPKHLH